jgi:hypothetical protein
LTTDRLEAAFTRATLAPLLKAAGRSGVLVGGQALAVWVDYFGIAPSWGTEASAAITRDTDFLGDRTLVERMAKALPARSVFPPRRALSALVGQLQIQRPDQTYLNVDVIHKVVGIDAGGVRRRAVEIEIEQAGETIRFAVMHPVDVLRSRLANLSRVADQRTPEGVEQLRLALRMVRAYIARVADEGDGAGGQRRALKAIEAVARLAGSAAGRKSRQMFAIDFGEAVPADRIRSERFQRERWPRLLVQLEGKGPGRRKAAGPAK